MRTKWLVMTALAGATLTFASGANAMTNTMPAGLAKSADQIGQIEQARWVCGPFRCWWRPNYYGYTGTTAIAIDRGGVGTGAGGTDKLSSAATDSSHWPCLAQGQF